jgi:hypothetical protein
MTDAAIANLRAAAAENADLHLLRVLALTTLSDLSCAGGEWTATAPDGTTVRANELPMLVDAVIKLARAVPFVWRGPAR